MQARAFFALGALALTFALGCSSSSPICGDGKVDPGEACDEGASNGQPGHCKSDCSGVATTSTASVKGDVMPFASEVDGPRVSGAKISILEHPEKSITTGADAHFQIDGLDVGSPVTLVFEHPSFHAMQTGTFTLGAHGIDPFAVQAVSNSLFALLQSVIGVTPNASDCIVSTTVTRLGGSLYVALRQGEEGATIALDPKPAGATGPIYFNANVVPDPKQTSTSKDGGAVYVNVPPGEYTLSGSKAGLVFEPVKITCRAGVLVNAGPTLGVSAHVVAPDRAGGESYASDAFSATSDALCDATAKCVQMKNGAAAYPDATRASCKTMFKDMWSTIDATCDASAGFRAAAKALFTCRGASCTVTLGGDEACTAEDAAYVKAMETYGACYAKAHAK